MQTCRRQEGTEVCARLEQFELVRSHPKARNAELFKGVYLIEGRSVRTGDGNSVSFSFECGGPEGMLTTDVVTTHLEVFRELEAELERYGVGEQHRIGFAAELQNFGRFLDLDPN